MADLAQYERELLRRNAALEERAAASIARAKAVVDGQASSHAGGGAWMAKSAAFAFGDGDPNGPSLETLADALYQDEVENYDPRAREREVMEAQARLRGEGGNLYGYENGDDEKRGRGAHKSPNKKQQTNSKPSSARQSRDGAFGARDSSETAASTFDASEDPVEFSDDAYGRLAKARIQALRDQLSQQGKELRDVHARLKDSDTELKSVLTDKQAVQKALKAANNGLEKEKRLNVELQQQMDGKSREVIETKKEADRNSRNTKSQQAETKSRDVRLNRALEEVERYKNLLNDARDSRKGGGEEQRRDLMELRSEVRVLQRQVRVARFPNPGTLLYLSAGDCCPYIAIYKTDDFL